MTTVDKVKRKRLKKNERAIKEIEFMVSVLGIKRKAKMSGIVYTMDATKASGVGKINWKTFTYTIGEDSDFILYDNEIEDNNRNIFIAIYKKVRELNNGERADK